MEGPLLPGANGFHDGVCKAPPLDTDALLDHIANVLAVTIGATLEDLQAPGSLLSPAHIKETQQRCTRFAQENDTALYIQKLEEDLDGIEEYNVSLANGPQTSYLLTPTYPSSPSCTACVAILKGPSPLDLTIPLARQIDVVKLPVAEKSGESPFQGALAIVQSVLGPMFDACAKSSERNSNTWGRAENDARTGLPSTQKRLKDLELSIRHLQQDSAIPQVNLPLHPIVQEAIDKAYAAGKKPTVEFIDPKVATESGFLNSLQSIVVSWVKSIHNATKVERDPSTGTATQEIDFWLSMESRLEEVEGQLRSEGVQLTLETLRNAKRFQATVSFSADTGLKEATEKVQKYNQLMKEFPLDELLSADSLGKVHSALDMIFNHLNKKLRVSPYPIKRALALVEAISGDLDSRLHELLNGRALMHLDYAEFEFQMSLAERIWRTWDENVKEFTNVAREVTRRRNEKFIPIKIAARHARTQDRLRYITTFRTNHEQLQSTIVNVLGPKLGGTSTENGVGTTVVAFGENIGDVDAVKEVSEAYAALKDVDVLDLGDEGTRIWVEAENTYNERTARVENSIIARLRDRLATAKTANDMFRVFTKFNALFVRPKIRGAIAEYQTQVIEEVKSDISALHERFKQQYGHSEAHAMAQLRDLPPVSGAVIWARQIERHLDDYMGKVENVLGKDWSLHTEGAKLQAETNLFRKKLDTRPIFESWLQDVQRRNLEINGRLFNIVRNRAAGNNLHIVVNFDPQVIALFKEVRNLLWLNHQIPHAINNVSKEAKRVYPYAVSLMESVRTYAQTVCTIEEMPNVAILLYGYQNEALTLIAKGIPLKWESFVHAYDLQTRQAALNLNGDNTTGSRVESKHVQFVRDFASAVSVLQAKTSTLLSISISVENGIEELARCPYRFESFRQHIETIQKHVDQLNLENYVNLPQWVDVINRRVGAVLLIRLRQAVSDWVQAFVESPNQDVDDATPEHDGGNGQSDKEWPRLESLVHEIFMRNQVIYLEPPLENARAAWLAQFQSWLMTVCDLPKIEASRYELRLNTSTERRSIRFSGLPGECTELLSVVYAEIERKILAVSEYVGKWLQFQSLWDLQSEQVYEILGDDLSKWLQLLQEIRKTRETFDTSEESRSFGRLTIEYGQVQTKINAKYDQWQHEILLKFAQKLGIKIVEVYADIERARKDLEAQSLDASSTAQAVAFITTVQQCKRKVKAWTPEVEIFRQGQTLLHRQRFQFGNDWLHVDQVDNEWALLNEILGRKSRIVQDQTDALRAKIMAEDTVVIEKIADAISRWNVEKPVSGTIPPSEASAILLRFDSKLTSLRTESEMVSKAKEALDLPPSPEDVVTIILEEVHDFKSVWAALSTIWSSINELRETLWTAIQPRKVRQSLDNLIKMTKDMPSRMRQYAAFEHVQNILRQLLKVNPLLGDLRSDCVRDRHWVKIFKALKPSKRYSPVSMTLGDVWDLQPTSSEAVIRDVIAQAQGEMALEEFLRQVRETWQNYSLDLVNYQNKCRLIRGWDDLFSKCSENLNSLQAMRHSPYYREFEEEASSWEEKLNRIHVLFDVWIDVQRQWVYLEGVFTGNADIKHLLPLESTRFQSINSEFFSVLRKVYRSPNILDVLAITGIQKSLERLAELLNKIQKALGEYLERERASFPRFYFVGDEDLLEIIGNSNDTIRIAKHLRKMFAGIADLIMEEDATITAFTSKEGEIVPLNRPISLVKIPKVNEWLAALEEGMKLTLADLLKDAVDHAKHVLNDQNLDASALEDYLNVYPAQIVVLAVQVCWTSATENALGGQGHLSVLVQQIRSVLDLLAAAVLRDLDPILRKKCEHLITEFVHQRDVTDQLIREQADTSTHHAWLLQMRYVYNKDETPLARLQIHMANATLPYGFEYLGVPERLVKTPLTDRCFLILTQALCQRLGGSPYGPAGTGKTESVKALGVELGRFTLVFCCDDSFDFQAMGRIFLGICRVGAWGCFDEFNRLEERILSAVSQQVQNIQSGLKSSAANDSVQIELIGRQLRVNQNTGIFITMNPGYAGRSNLPDNLKKLFRSVAMSRPDKELIAEVMLYSQGFSQAKQLSRQTVPFFEKCSRTMTKQAHYDFGLRALKSVLVSSGGLKRARVQSHGLVPSDAVIVEPQIMLQSLRETIAPKLIREDAECMLDIEAETFPGVQYVPAALDALKAAITSIASASNLLSSEAWLSKILQLYQIQSLHHGVMMVGESGSGKSTAWKTLVQALQITEGVDGIFHIIDPKVMSKESLYGSLDSTTREWTDGLFTSILRKIIDNLRGEDTKRHWIIFDGDVDPEWVENLNSVLDDNKLLTLPNGERLNLPANVRIMFEVETLRYATPATVSRCGMVWFSEDTVTIDMTVSNYLGRLQSAPFEELEEDGVATSQTTTRALAIQIQVADLVQTRFATADFLKKALSCAHDYHHIMTFTTTRALDTLFSLLNKACRSLIEYEMQHPDFPLEPEQIESFVSKKLLLAMVWSFTGDCPLTERKDFGNLLSGLSTIEMPPTYEGGSLIDFDVTLPKAHWTPWQSQVPVIEVNTHSITQTDVVIPTLDTVRHEDVLYSWLAEHKPLLLCGPPGSGKTMTLFSALRKLQNMEVVGLNFSSATTPDLLIKTFEQYCEYRKTLSGVLLSPKQIGRWLVIFCDEINLPAPDRYGTQRAVSFLRQLVEQNGFWRTSDKAWVTLDRIQFVGACNPPTDAGRTPLGLRFLRHAPLIMVDYPGEISLHQIYGTFNHAVLKIIPALRGYSDALTKAMVQFYIESQKQFTPDVQPHYVYSPRELTRWVRGVYEALKPLENLSLEGLVRIWAHEAFRLFQDRLIAEHERDWTEQTVHRIALEHFPALDEEQALAGPILFSNWLSKNYVSVERESLRDFVKARLRTFCEEEVDVPLVLFNDVLDHVLRIDRVFRQPQGHLILIGVSGSGKTTLSRFVAWMNGLKVFQIKVHGKYSAEDFDDDLRSVLRRCGCKGEKICFIMDESNVLDSGFLERMNTLLANAEVPGLFEGDEFAALMTACKEGAQRQGLLLDSQDELYKWFTQQIVKNLHVVFTMNPPKEGLSSRAATSPALFNRCVLNWFGDWSDQALYQVGTELTQSLDLDRAHYTAPSGMPIVYRDLNLPSTYREAVINTMVYVHYSIRRFNQRLHKQQNKVTYLTPRHFLDFVAQFAKIYTEKREDLEEQQRHLNVGLDKLRETVDKVRDLRQSLAEKQNQLEKKDKEANEKLRKMLEDQQTAEKKKATSLEVQSALERQEEEIARRREVVLTDLANAEPAVAEAKKSVSNIKRQHLTEVRSMQNPPAGVKLALEAVCTLLGHKADSWKTILGIVRRDDFISSIVNYENEAQMTKAHRIKMRNEYLSKEDFTYERVYRASKACGPLVQWVEAQVVYSDILDRVGPLREEVEQLEEGALQTKAEAAAIANTVDALEKSIHQYKSEYADLISETQAIKTEMSRVESKVTRSVRLLDSLSSERARWEDSSHQFESQIDTIVGDVLTAAAFMAYSGFYDQQYRKAMIEDWQHQLFQSGIKYKSPNPIMDYLSTADERLTWHEHALPVDDLCTENAIILKRYNRYPLIIDPSGRISEFLQNDSKDRRLTVTSFLDASFTKQLESCLRFGNPILIQDAEHFDPILNHVLNKEYQKTGGRVLIQMGKQEIDFSPTFKLYLSTRDPSATFAPDICSRTTFVNFTVTQSSLQTQTLNDVLKSERPDIDERRSNLIRMQGEFRVHLRQLEKRLLQALNESRGNILDDDNVINTLETLKREASEISAKVSETEGIMSEVNMVTQQYEVIARSCSAIFTVLEQLSHLHHFYQFSLQYFVDIFNAVLAIAKDKGGDLDHTAKIDLIVHELFAETFRRTSLALLQRDRITLALLLAQASPCKMNRNLLDVILDQDLVGLDVSTQPDRWDDSLAAACKLPALKASLELSDQSKLNALLTEEYAEGLALQLWPGDVEGLDRHLMSLILIKLLRIDRFVPAAEQFVSAVFGKGLLDVMGDLGEVVKQVVSSSPVALGSSPGFDASFKVENLVQMSSKHCTNVAMGSNESVASADKAINNAAATGSWVLVKNVHLAPSWLQGLEKRLDSLKPHTDFRLFLSMEASPKISVSLLRASRVLMYEQPVGIRANMKDSLTSLTARATQEPRERSKVYLLLCFLHAVVQERLRYAPSLGWKGFWEFNDSDYECGAFIVDTWIESVSHGRTNISPQKIPWSMIQTLITEMYGGKIDDNEDHALLGSLVSAVITATAFEDDFQIVKDTEDAAGLTLPNASGWRDVLHWVSELPEREPPTYLGLPANAEKLLLVAQAKEMVDNTRTIVDMLEDGEHIMPDGVAVVV